MIPHKWHLALLGVLVIGVLWAAIRRNRAQVVTARNAGYPAGTVPPGVSAEYPNAGTTEV